MKSHNPQLVLPCLFSFPAVKNSFLRVFPPTVGWSFFLAGSSPPNIDGPASTAIWANCWVGNDCGDLPTSSSCSASAIFLIISSGLRGVPCTNDGGAPVLGAPGFYMYLHPGLDLHLHMHLGSHHHPHIPPALPFAGCPLCSNHTGIQERARESAN